MRYVIAAAVAVGAAALALAAAPPQDGKRVARGEQVRFVYFAVLEGLMEEAPDAKLVRKVLDTPTPGLFVEKCPVCDPVREAMESYLRPMDTAYGPNMVGSGFPTELAKGLGSADRAEVMKSLSNMVDRYVDRRFERLRMTDAERGAMRIALKEGMKLGLAGKPADFGDYCPSCDGANGIGH